MKRKTVKIISGVMITMMVLMSMSTFVFADDYLNPDSIVAKDSSGAAADVQSLAGGILSIVQVVAIAVAVIMLIVLAIKYISASPEGKADIKKSAIQYVVGAVLLFASSGILEIIKRFADSIGTGTGTGT